MNTKAKAKFNPLDEDADVQVTFTGDEFRSLTARLQDHCALNLSRHLLREQGGSAEFLDASIDRAKWDLLALLNAALDRKDRADGTDK
jgi:hypothetical protein